MRIRYLFNEMERDESGASGNFRRIGERDET